MSSYMVHGSQNRILGPPDTFPGYIGSFPGPVLMQILIFYSPLVQWSGGKIPIFLSKEVQEMDQYTQETCLEVQVTCFGILKHVTRHKELLH